MKLGELRAVKVETITPNPWRDGEGHATWKTMAAHYPILPAKVERLKESMLSPRESGKPLGVWEGIIARPCAAGTVELAFGHHRVVAARELIAAGKLPNAVPLVIKELTDGEMLLHMARENDEEWKHFFLLSVMNPIEATVRAYAEGKITLPAVSEKATARRSAPSFISHPAGAASHLQKPYTAETVALYLGWAVADGAGIQASLRVKTAIAALELIEQGVLQRAQFATLGSQQAGELVRLTRAALKAKEESDAATARVKEEALKRAESQGNKNATEALKRELASASAALRSARARQ